MPVSRRIGAALSITALGVGLLTGCLPEGPPGVVVAKDNRWDSATKTRPNYLTVRTANGERKDFKVSVENFDRCTVGEHYPACTKSKNDS
ncbi:hypothetical protein ACIRF8_28080 [Streptomyces sp. NPDC102406]|uniref:hypothetical protein n=1 Tax=Streptomyces sp. NPDC102406 TaxID=3366171 RepID=UPI003813D63B